MLALLTKFKEEQTEAVLRMVLTNIKKYANQEKDLKKYLEQLLILARIRKLEDITEKIIDDMPITYDIEKDDLYKRGFQVGLKIGLERAAKMNTEGRIEKPLLAIKYLRAGKTIKETAIFTGLSKKMVKKIKKTISRL